MPNLTVAYKGAKSTNLYTAYYNGAEWQGNTRVVISPTGNVLQSDVTPGVCLYNNRLYLVYKEPGPGVELCLAYTDGAEWSGGVSISGLPGGIWPKSSSAPSLVVFNGLMYAVYQGAFDNAIYIAWSDGTTWYGGQSIVTPGGFPETSGSIAAVSFQGRLFLVYKGKSSNTLYTASSSDGTTWSGNTAINPPVGTRPQSDVAPGAVVFGHKLHLVYKATDTKLYIASFDGLDWTGGTPIGVQPDGHAPKSADSPAALLLNNNNVYIVYKGAGNEELYSASFEKNQWFGDTRIQVNSRNVPKSSDAPGLNFSPVHPGLLEDWLSGLPDNVPICDINLPGTHDSAAISTWYATPYACHNTSITAQLNSGVRLLDVRLKVKKAAGAYEFMTCHGDIGSSTGANEYQSFLSLLDECTEFVAWHSSEFIAMSLKIDDWGGYALKSTDVYNALDLLLQGRPLWTGSTMPDLGSVRGTIYLLNRMDQDVRFGAPVRWPDNTDGAWAPSDPNRSFAVYVQDRYENLPTVSSVEEKLRLFVRAFAVPRGGQMLLNFASATYLKAWGVYIMGPFLKYLGQNQGNARPARLGWTFFDYEPSPFQTDVYGFLSVVPLVVSSNSSYGTYPKAYQMI